jgi:hypothetical protein
MGQQVLNIAIRHAAMFKIQPDAVETKVCRLLDESRDVVPKAAHTDRLIVTDFGKRLAFSHEELIL